MVKDDKVMNFKMIFFFFTDILQKSGYQSSEQLIYFFKPKILTFQLLPMKCFNSEIFLHYDSFDSMNINKNKL